LGAWLLGRLDAPSEWHHLLCGDNLMTHGIIPARPASYDKKVGLVLQGGGALGSYQAGVYEALSSSGYTPDWVAAISIGATNAAIIAGNALKDRVHRLRSFWEAITAPTMLWPNAIGALVNVSGFHVDPGYRGQLTFAVFNAGLARFTSDRVFVAERGFALV
jgi:predicted acylesterase/phospholipase RssA